MDRFFSDLPGWGFQSASDSPGLSCQPLRGIAAGNPARCHRDAGDIGMLSAGEGCWAARSEGKFFRALSFHVLPFSVRESQNGTAMPKKIWFREINDQNWADRQKEQRAVTLEPIKSMIGKKNKEDSLFKFELISRQVLYKPQLVLAFHFLPKIGAVSVRTSARWTMDIYFPGTKGLATRCCEETVSQISSMALQKRQSKIKEDETSSGKMW